MKGNLKKLFLTSYLVYQNDWDSISFQFIYRMTCISSENCELKATFSRIGSVCWIYKKKLHDRINKNHFLNLPTWKISSLLKLCKWNKKVFVYQIFRGFFLLLTRLLYPLKSFNRPGVSEKQWKTHPIAINNLTFQKDPSVSQSSK